MKRIAFWLRKLADFFDSRVGPSDKLTIIIEADTTQADSELVKLQARLESLAAAMPKGAAA